MKVVTNLTRFFPFCINLECELDRLKIYLDFILPMYPTLTEGILNCRVVHTWNKDKKLTCISLDHPKLELLTGNLIWNLVYLDSGLRILLLKVKITILFIFLQTNTIILSNRFWWPIKISWKYDLQSAIIATYLPQ